MFFKHLEDIDLLQMTAAFTAKSWREEPGSPPGAELGALFDVAFT